MSTFPAACSLLPSSNESCQIEIKNDLQNTHLLFLHKIRETLKTTTDQGRSSDKTTTGARTSENPDGLDLHSKSKPWTHSWHEKRTRKTASKRHAKTARGENGGGANREKVPHLSLACRGRKNARDRRRRRRNSWQARVRTGGEGWSGLKFAGGAEEEGSVRGSAAKNGTVEARERGFIGWSWTAKKRIRQRSPLLEDFLEVYFFFQLFVRADCWEGWV